MSDKPMQAVDNAIEKEFDKITPESLADATTESVSEKQLGEDAVEKVEEEGKK